MRIVKIEKNISREISPDNEVTFGNFEVGQKGSIVFERSQFFIVLLSTFFQNYVKFNKKSVYKLLY